MGMPENSDPKKVYEMFNQRQYELEQKDGVKQHWNNVLYKKKLKIAQEKEIRRLKLMSDDFKARQSTFKEYIKELDDEAEEIK